MVRFVRAKLPPKSHLRYFHLLSEEEKARSVRRLSANHSREAIAQLTGLDLKAIAAIQAQPLDWRGEPR